MAKRTLIQFIMLVHVSIVRFVISFNCRLCTWKDLKELQEAFFYTLHYLFAVEGRVYKVVEWLDSDGVSHSELLDVYEVTTPEPIRAIQISKKVIGVNVYFS